MAIPDSNTGWSLQDVINEVSPASNDLIACFTAAISSYFDPAYYGTENDMLEFRNYGSHNEQFDISFVVEQSIDLDVFDGTVELVDSSCNSSFCTVIDSHSFNKDSNFGTVYTFTNVPTGSYKLRLSLTGAVWNGSEYELQQTEVWYGDAAGGTWYQVDAYKLTQSFTLSEDIIIYALLQDYNSPEDPNDSEGTGSPPGDVFTGGDDQDTTVF